MSEIAGCVNGVQIWSDGDATLVSVNELTDDLKVYIRERLAEICWGPTVNGRKLKTHTYEKTMQSLWRRISTHAETTQIGMIGEMLTHLFLADPRFEYSSVNRFFNLEERSIKKGFDLVLSYTDGDELTFVEVKSSAVTPANTATQLLKLLKTADGDIYGKLNSPADNLWDNALNHCRSALRGDLRDRIEEILEDLRDDALENPKAEDYNVILSGISFSGAADFCEMKDLFDRIKGYSGWGSYKSIGFFSAQKKTYQAILQFVEEEAAEACR